MNEKKNLKRKAREALQRRQANRVVNGIFIALILIAVLALAAYWAIANERRIMWSCVRYVKYREARP